MRRLLLLALLTGPAAAVPVTLRLAVDPPAAEVWEVRDEGYQFLGSCAHPLVLEVAAQDQGRRPCLLRLFFRRPWEKGLQRPPARALPLTLMPRGDELRWPEEGVYRMSPVDRLLAWPFLPQAGLGLAAASALAAWAALTAWRKRVRRQSRGQLAEAARALASSFQREQLLDFLAASIARSLPHERGLIWQDRVVACWGGPAEDVVTEGATQLSEHLAQHHSARSWPLQRPLRGEGEILAVGLDRQGFLLLQRANPFGEEEEASLLALAAPVSQALQGDTGLQRMAAGLAHELNTPLGAILLSVESALTVLERAPDKAQARLEKATMAVDRAHTVVSDLLLYSRQKLEEPRPLTWAEVVEGLECEVRLKAPAPFQGDRDMLRRALAHLVQNARDASATEIVLEIGPRELALRDDGRGMSEEVRQRACEPFYTTRPGGRGSGLGLAVAQKVFELHGWGLRLESQPEKGTTVRVATV